MDKNTESKPTIKATFINQVVFLLDIFNNDKEFLFLKIK